MQPPKTTARKKSTSTTYSQSALERPIHSKRSPSARMFFWFLRKNAKERDKPPSVRENARPVPSAVQLRWQGEQCKTPSVRANARPFPPAVQLRWQGERCISNDISRYKRNIRVSRMDVNRVGPCVRPQSTKYTRIHFDKTVKTP